MTDEPHHSVAAHTAMAGRERDVPGTVLVAGASGVVGTAAVERFLGDGWDVVAVSRRRAGDRRAAPVRPRARRPAPMRRACRPGSAEADDVTHVVYTAVYESPVCVPGWCDRDADATPT